MIDFLKSLLTNLNGLEVKGRDNLDILLGCMVAIENVINQLQNPKEEEVSEDG